MIRVILNGALGRMGLMMSEAIGADDGFECAALADVNAQPGSGVLNRLSDCEAEADVLVDFSHHSAAEEVAAFCESRGMAAVIATTGHTPEEADRLARLSEKVPVFMSANMSIGVALLCEMAQKAALMFPSADIEIVECHHNKKLDVPSGTALLIARRLTEVREGATVLVGRHENGLRPSGEIGAHSLRMGNEVGRHEVIISTGSETIILRHEAESRSLFAQGALAAARFVAGKEPGLYDMRHLLAEN